MKKERVAELIREATGGWHFKPNLEMTEKKGAYVLAVELVSKGDCGHWLWLSKSGGADNNNGVVYASRAWRGAVEAARIAIDMGGRSASASDSSISRCRKKRTEILLRQAEPGNTRGTAATQRRSPPHSKARSCIGR